MARLINLMLVERKMSKKDLAAKLGTSQSNLSGKLSRDNLSENELRKIAEACNAQFEAGFVLNDTGKQIK